MPTVQYRNDTDWQNYHLTIGKAASPGDGPVLRIESLASIDATDATQTSGLERFAALGGTLFEHLSKLEAQVAAADTFAAGMVGAGWSFAPLVGTPVSQLLCDGLSCITEIAADEYNINCRVPADYIVLAGGGTPMMDIATFAEARDRSIRTSGSFLGTSIAGAFGTSSHGSRLGYGGIQNMVLGMHLIVGSSEHVWIERESSPVLSTAALERLAINGVPVRLVRDDDRFEDALVHLGSMGIVNGVAIELTGYHSFVRMLRLEALSAEFLKDVADGDFDAVASRLGCNASPAFYELTIDPHALLSGQAMHTMYFPTNRSPALTDAAKTAHTADAFAQVGENMVQQAKLGFADKLADLSDKAGVPPPIPDAILRHVMQGAASAFEYYRRYRNFPTTDEPFDPEDPANPPRKWSELHAGGITTGTPGALYNASFAIPRELVPQAVSAICAAVTNLPPSFVFTLRFVDNAAGTLAFTRFDHTAVIEIDGLSPWICEATKAQIDQNAPEAGQIIQALDMLAYNVPTGAALVREALEKAHIHYSMHWAKLGSLDRNKVFADYGYPSDPDSLIRRWRETREALLSDFGKSVFWNNAVVAYGLVAPQPDSKAS